MAVVLIIEENDFTSQDRLATGLRKLLIPSKKCMYQYQTEKISAFERLNKGKNFLRKFFGLKNVHLFEILGKDPDDKPQSNFGKIKNPYKKDPK